MLRHRHLPLSCTKPHMASRTETVEAPKSDMGVAFVSFAPHSHTSVTQDFGLVLETEMQHAVHGYNQRSMLTSADHRAGTEFITLCTFWTFDRFQSWPPPHSQTRSLVTSLELDAC